MLRYPTAVQNSYHFQRGNVSKLASPAKINWRTNTAFLLLSSPPARNYQIGQIPFRGRIRLARSATNGRSIPDHYSFSARPSVQQSNCLVIRGTRRSFSGANRGITRDFRRASRPSASGRSRGQFYEMPPLKLLHKRRRGPHARCARRVTYAKRCVEISLSE